MESTRIENYRFLPVSAIHSSLCEFYGGRSLRMPIIECELCNFLKIVTGFPRIVLNHTFTNFGGLYFTLLRSISFAGFRTAGIASMTALTSSWNVLILVKVSFSTTFLFRRSLLKDREDWNPVQIGRIVTKTTRIIEGENMVYGV